MCSLLVRRRVRGLWRYNHTASYIASRVAATAAEEGLNSYRANSSDCAASAAGEASHLADDTADLAEKGMAVRPPAFPRLGTPLLHS